MSQRQWSWSQLEACLAGASVGSDFPSASTTLLQIGGDGVPSTAPECSCLTLTHPAEVEILTTVPLGLAILASRDVAGRTLALVRSPEREDWSSLLSWQGLMSVPWTGSVADPLPSSSLPSLVLPAPDQAMSDRIDVYRREWKPLSLTPEHRLVLEAGLRLLNDDGEGSHACAQQLEGQGRYRTADYWHAIFHRREPDYGNARYWFRRVGSHPVLEELAGDWVRLISSMPDMADAPSPLQGGVFSSDRFVQACEMSRQMPAEYRALLEELQYREMLRLLAWSWIHGA